MGCCGQKRKRYGGGAAAPATRGRRRVVAAQSRVRRSSDAYFQYVGKTALTAVGPVSGQRYRFDKPGAIIAVDPRDRRSLEAVPHLRQVGKPREKEGER